jgi:hypothetical protein
VNAASDVDVVVLGRDASPLSAEVRRGIDLQVGVRLRLHRVIGSPLATDAHRWETIARARNAGKRLGRSPWLLFLDDDVRLAPDAVAVLLGGLLDNPVYGALAADYLGEGGGGWQTPHVAMGATLFRRQALDRITFRWAGDRCECQCCCDDLRRLWLGIRYWPGARAWHLKTDPLRSHAAGPQVQQEADAAAAGGPGGRALVAFDRRHHDKFRRRFLRSLRTWGNHEPVTAVTYGLYPSEQRALAALPGVEVLPRPQTETLPPVRRLEDFQTVLERWPPQTPVAYWDAGDVFFQASLAELWQTVHRHPDRLLAVREPQGHPDNPAVAAWTLSITDPTARERAFGLLSRRPFLNSGFAAGTARSMLAYFREAFRLRHSAELAGSTDWGDQTALNLYCHRRPEGWLEIDEGWNYCMHARRPEEFRLRPDGRLEHARGGAIRVVHGNAHSLRNLELSWF